MLLPASVSQRAAFVPSQAGCGRGGTRNLRRIDDHFAAAAGYNMYVVQAIKDLGGGNEMYLMESSKKRSTGVSDQSLSAGLL